MSRLLVCALAVSLTGCVDLDGFVYNPIHCSTVGPETCEDSGLNPWDQACVPCEEPYDWTRSYDWRDTTLDAGTPDVRPITTAVTQHVIPSDDGEAELDAWFLPSHGQVPELADTTILYNHGNYMGVEHYMPRARFLHEAGYNVLIWDYRGYGKTLPDSTPSTEQFLADGSVMTDDHGYMDTMFDMELRGKWYFPPAVSTKKVCRVGV